MQDRLSPETHHIAEPCGGHRFRLRSASYGGRSRWLSFGGRGRSTPSCALPLIPDRHPVIPDRADGPANGRDVVAAGKDRVSLFGNANAGKFARQVGEVGHFHAGDIVEVSGVVAVAADAVTDLPDPAGNILDGSIEALPLAGNGGAAALPSVTLAETGDEQRFAGRKTRRRKVVDSG